MHLGENVREVSAAPLEVQPPRPTGASKSRARTCFEGFSLTAVTLLVCLLAVEGLLRFVPLKRNEIEYGDPVLGFAPKPNSVQTFSFPEYGPSLAMRINNRGFHEDHDTSLASAPGTQRLVVLGDSQSAGLCQNQESYPHVLEQMLNRQGGRYEVINAAVGKYSPYQYLVRAERDVAPLHPNHLVVTMYLGNDLVDLLRHDDRPYLTLEPPGRVQAHPPVFMVYENPSRPAGWWENARIYGLTRIILGPTVLYQISRARALLGNVENSGQSRWEVARYMLEVKRLTDISDGLMTQALYQKVWFQHFPDTLETAFRLNEAVMRMFRELCARNDIRLTYVLLPTKVRIEPARLEPLFAQAGRYNPEWSVGNMQAFEDSVASRVIETARKLNVELADLRAPLLAHRGAEMYFRNDMHLNVAGNRVVAQALADFLHTHDATGAGHTAARSAAGSH
jgi:lysophospholipase L1-like esterase